MWHVLSLFSFLYFFFFSFLFFFLFFYLDMIAIEGGENVLVFDLLRGASNGLLFFYFFFPFFLSFFSQTASKQMTSDIITLEKGDYMFASPSLFMITFTFFSLFPRSFSLFSPLFQRAVRITFVYFLSSPPFFFLGAQG